jgi:GAF domain-containing protein
MQTPDYSQFTQALAAKGRQPQSAFAALYALTNAMVGAKLFTIMVRDRVRGTSQRVFSNMPDAYPVGGAKPANMTDWSRQVIDAKRTFVANDIEGISAVFDDHALIKSLGCESVVNVPIVVDGEVLGTINCLHEAGFYTEEKIEAAEALKIPGAACLLLNERDAAKGGQ